MHIKLSPIETEIFLCLNSNNISTKKTVDNFSCKVCDSFYICNCYDEIKAHNSGLCKSCNRLDYTGRNIEIRDILGYNTIEGSVLLQQHDELEICLICDEDVDYCKCYKYITNQFCLECNREILDIPENIENESIFRYYAYFEKTEDNLIISSDLVKESSSIPVEETTNLDLQCILCCTNKINTVLLKCRHAMFCSDCINKVNSCPSCRRSFNKKDLLHVFLP